MFVWNSCNVRYSYDSIGDLCKPDVLKELLIELPVLLWLVDPVLTMYCGEHLLNSREWRTCYYKTPFRSFSLMHNGNSDSYIAATENFGSLLRHAMHFFLLTATANICSSMPNNIQLWVAPEGCVELVSSWFCMMTILFIPGYGNHNAWTWKFVDGTEKQWLKNNERKTWCPNLEYQLDTWH